MKIVIAGAGDVGFHLARLLAIEHNDITLVDIDKEILQYAASHLDVLTIQGDVSSIKTLEKVNIKSADIFLAVTTYEQTNLLACMLSKRMGAKKVIARVINSEYLTEEQKANFLKMGVDNLISPRQLTSMEIDRLLDRCAVTDAFDFEEGKMSVLGITIDRKSTLVNRTLGEFVKYLPPNSLKVLTILRGHTEIPPTKDEVIRIGDHIYLMTIVSSISRINELLGKEPKKVDKVMIIGGSGLGIETAKLLEQKYHVTIVEQDKATCEILASELDKSLIINANPGNTELLKEEGLEQMDAFVALSPNSEINIISCLVAEEIGVYKTIALVENSAYIRISQNIGIDTLINKKLIAANNIFRFVRKGVIEAIASLHGVTGEIIEFVVHKSNRLTKHPIKDLKLPSKAIVAGVIRGEDSIIPDENFQLNLNDKVIIFAHPDSISVLEERFR